MATSTATAVGDVVTSGECPSTLIQVESSERARWIITKSRDP
jgi:hypothetical protein